MARLETTTLQGNDAVQGDYSAGQVLEGYGLSFYNADDAKDVEIVTQKGTSVVYTAVPAGVQILCPLFKEIGANTTSTDLTIALITWPFL